MGTPDLVTANPLYSHLSPDRYRLHGATVRRGLERDATYGFWEAAHPDDVRMLLRRPELQMPDIAGVLDRIAERTGDDLANLRDVARHSALALNGEEHAIHRRAVHEHLYERFRDADIGRAVLAEATAWSDLPEGTVDLVDAFIAPLATVVARRIFAIPHHVPELALGLSALFDRFQGPAALRRLERRFAMLREAYKAQGYGDEEATFFLAALTAGADPLAGMIADGLHRQMSRAGRSRPKDWCHDGFPIAAGVPVTERVAVAGFEHAGVQVAAGEYVRLHFQSTAYADDTRTRHFVFGTGVHACVGRHVATAIWNELETVLRRDARTFEIVEFALERSRLFIVPERFVVRIST